MLLRPVFSPGVADRIENAFIDKVIVTDTIPVRPEEISPKLEVLTVADHFASAIARIHDGRSVSALF